MIEAVLFISFFSGSAALTQNRQDFTIFSKLFFGYLGHGIVHRVCTFCFSRNYFWGKKGINITKLGASEQKRMPHIYRSLNHLNLWSSQ